MKVLIASLFLTFAVSANAELLVCDVTESSSNVQIEKSAHYEIELTPTTNGIDVTAQFELEYFDGLMTVEYLDDYSTQYQEMVIDIGNDAIGQTVINEGAKWAENTLDYKDPTGSYLVWARCEVKPSPVVSAP